jgi:regulatory protein
MIMQIAQVLQKNASIWELQLADGRCYEIDYPCVVEYALLDRLELEEETLQAMRQTFCERHALQQALRWLDFRPYTYKAMFQRLSPEYGAQISFAVMERLTQMGLINDYHYAQQMARSLIERKSYGMRRAAEMMRQKGLPQNVITAALQPYQADVMERLQRLIHRHYAEKLSDRTDRNAIEKTKAALVRKGYSFSEVNAAIQQYQEALS